MPDQYQNFSNPTIIPDQKYGWQGLQQSGQGAVKSFMDALTQHQAQQQALQLNSQLALNQEKAKIWAEQQDPVYQLRKQMIQQMGGGQGMGGALNGQMPQGMPSSNQPMQPQIGGGGAVNFNPLNPVAGESVARYTMNPNFMFGGKEPFADNPAFKQQQDQDKLRQSEIIKGPAEAAVGKVTLAKESLQNIDDIMKTLFPDGTPASFNRGLATGSNLPGGWLPFMPSVRPDNPLSKGDDNATRDAQNIFRKMGSSIAARQLIQTGVAARPEETAKLVSQYAPNLFSNPDSAYSGLQDLKKFYEQYLNMAEPDKRLAMTQQGGSSPDPQVQSKTLDANTAKQLLQAAGGDKNKARELAKQQGYSF